MQVYREITPLKEHDVFVILDSINNGFDYPIHNHPEFELTLILGISGTRIVGDSTEKYYESDLVLLGPYLYHKWDGEEEKLRSGQRYRVITLQFDSALFDSQLLRKEHFYLIRKLMENAGRGIRFYGKTFAEAKKRMVNLTKTGGFSSVIDFLSLLDLLSCSSERTCLASESFNPQLVKSESRRIQAAHKYILENFARQDLRLSDVAAKVNMSDSAFSHFFKKYANKSFTQFMLDVRIGYACKLLLATDDLISQICFEAGFNNITNFNRQFKKHRSCTPLEYRRRYKENNNFDWENQVTPYQFLPPSANMEENLKPKEYTTRLIHS